MIVLELFAGTRSISRAFEKRGHKTFSIEWDRSFSNIDIYDDINNVTADDIIKLCGKVPDVIWASPDCTTYSLAGIHHHRVKDLITGELRPVSEYAKFCDKTNIHVMELINELKPKYYFIENPRGGFRKMLFVKDIPCYTVTYCQYGDTRMKPTDIFTNYKNPNFKPPCHNGDSCHVRAPRGATTGTQGLKDHKERSRIPDALCDYIVELCERN